MQIQVTTPADLEAYDDAPLRGGARAVVTDLYPTGRFVLDRSSAYAGVDYVNVIPTATSQGQWINEANKLGTEEELSVDLPGVAGSAGYYLPIGHFFLDAPGMVSVDVDLGSGFVPFTGAFTVIHRGDGNPGFAPPLSVRDAATGVRLDAGGATTVRVRWIERRLAYHVPSISKVRLVQQGPDWVLDSSIVWKKETKNGPVIAATNGLQLATLPDGYQWEFWRRTLREGGLRSGQNITHMRDGRRFVPYERFSTPSTGNLLLHISQFSHYYQGRFQFKLAVYDPFTGARGPLSDLTAVVNRVRDFIVLASSADPRVQHY